LLDHERAWWLDGQTTSTLDSKVGCDAKVGLRLHLCKELGSTLKALKEKRFNNKQIG